MAALGSAPGIMVGVGVGTAAAAAIEPLVEPGKQQAWSNASNRVLDPGLYAALVAQGAMDLQGVAQPLAKRSGYNEDQFNRLVYLAQRAPDLALTLELWRRGLFGKPATAEAIAYVDHALAKEQIEAQYWPGIKELFNERLSAPVIALAIVRGIMQDERNFLPVSPPTGVGKVPAFPVSALKTLDEAAATGFDPDRLEVLTALAGRPPGPELMAQATFRQIIERTDYERAISEGDVRNEWRDAIFEVSRQILSANNYAELELRGFFDTPTRRLKTAQHGMSNEDSDNLVDLLGRSISVHQVTTGLARGGKYPGNYANVPEPFKSAIQRSNIREEWAELDYVNRYSYPTGFQIRAETEAGNLTQTEAEQILLELGWVPKWATHFSTAWSSKSTGTKGNPWVAKAEQQWWTAAHKAFVKDGTQRSVIEPVMQVFVTDLADRDAIFQWWTDEKAVVAGTVPGA